MRISMLQSFNSVKNSDRNNTRKMSIPNSLAPLKSDTISISFQGKTVYLKGNVSEVNDNEFPDDLYLNLDEVYETFENQRSYHRFEKFPHTLGKLLAKRMEYLGLAENARYSSFGSCGNKHDFSVYEYRENDSKKAEKSYEMDCTKEYKELEEFFTGGANCFSGAEDDMEQIKKGLPEILKKQGWIK